MGTSGGKITFQTPGRSGAIKITSEASKAVQAPHIEFNVCDGLDLNTQYVNTRVEVKKSSLRVKLEERRKLRPTGYALRVATNYAPRNWDFQASKDGKIWHTLSSHQHDPTIPAKKGGVGYWRVGDSKSPTTFQGPPIVDAHLTRTGPFGETVEKVSKLFPRVSLRTSFFKSQS